MLCNDGKFIFRLLHILYCSLRAYSANPGIEFPVRACYDMKKF